MKNRTTWYLIVEMNDGELRWIGDWKSTWAAIKVYKFLVEGATRGAEDMADVKTIKLISVENRGEQ